MTRHYSSLAASAAAVTDLFEAHLRRDDGARLVTGLPLRAGWYRTKIRGLKPGEIIELRLDFGLGFVGCHSVRAKGTGSTGTGAELFVRLFKQVSGVELARTSPMNPEGAAAEISFERLSGLFVWSRRLVEQFHMTAKALRSKGAGSRHHRPRRLWSWAGLQAFPSSLPATGETSYQLWKRIVGERSFDEPPRGLEYAPSEQRRRGSGRSLSSSWASRTTVIIPTRDRADLLKLCLEGLLASTRPQPGEIIIHDNGSEERATLRLLAEYASYPGIRVIRDELPFNFSRINNEAAALARGDILVFLNNDTEALSDDWIDQLAEVAADPTVGCAGPLLLTRAGTIQHAGLMTGPGGIAAHLHAGVRPENADPIAPITLRNVSAVTGACLATEKSKFLAVGGFDADHLPVAFNDVDLCLRFERHGLRTVFVPAAKLIHLGSATRDTDDFTTGTERFRAEFRLMRERWGPRLDFDPYFPRHMRLTRSGPQLRLA